MVSINAFITSILSSDLFTLTTKAKDVLSQTTFSSLFQFETGETRTIGQLIVALGNDPTEQNEVDLKKVVGIVKDVATTGQLRQPIVVVRQPSGKEVIMSGRHRTHAVTALAALGCSFLTQKGTVSGKAVKEACVPVFVMNVRDTYQLDTAVIDANSSRAVRPDERAAIKLGSAGIRDLSSLEGKSFSKGSTIPKSVFALELMRAYDGKLSGTTVNVIGAKIFAGLMSSKDDTLNNLLPQGSGTTITAEDIETTLGVVTDVATWLSDNTERLSSELGNVARATKDVAAQYLSSIIIPDDDNDDSSDNSGSVEFVSDDDDDDIEFDIA